jgi:parvulin-like peptidyl-prolyl isomerase
VKKHDTVNRAQIQGTQRKKRPGKQSTWIFILIIAVAVVAAYFFIAQPQLSNTPEDIVLVTINGEPLYQSELDSQWQALPVQAKLQLDREELLNQLIQERLLMQEAEAQGITVTEEEVQAFLNLQLQQTGTSEEQFSQVLSQQGTSIEEVKQIYRRQLTIASLFEQEIGEEPMVQEEDILAYYEANKEQFYRDQQVTVRHILIETDENVTEKPEIVLEIEESLDEAGNANFCELVNEYTMDLASRETCGEYTFPRGMMVPAFEEAGFSLDIGERETVRSQFGYHIILKDATIPAGYSGLDTVLADYPGEPTVRDLIGQVVVQEQARSVFDTYVAELEAEANIIYVATE